MVSNRQVEDQLRPEDVLIEALAVGMTHAEAGNLVGLSAKTVQRRLGDPAFRDAVDAHRQAHLETICGKLIGLGQTALEVLIGVLDHGEDRDRVHVAEIVLRWIVPYRKHAELERRVADLQGSDSKRAGDDD